MTKLRCTQNIAAVLTFVGVALVGSQTFAQGVAAPDSIAKAGKIVYCSDLSSPPLSYVDESNQTVGSDVDLGKEIAKRFGVKAEFANTPFDGLIPALQAKHCDAILSELFDKPKRREVVDFVDYMKSGQALLVEKGNPKKITSLADLSGVKIAAENGTTIQTLVEEQNKKFAADGKAPADLVIFPKDTEALQALMVHQVDVYGTTVESAGHQIDKTGGAFEMAGEPFSTIMAGIATRKDDPAMHDAIQKAFDAIKADGTALNILKKWHMDSGAL